MPQLFYYKLVFLTELLIAEFLFSFRLNRRKHFAFRCLAGLAFCYLTTFFFPLLSYSGWYSSMMFCIIFLCTYFAWIIFCFDTSLVNGFFIAITAYTVQHISYEIYSLISISFNAGGILKMYGSATFDFSNISETMILIALVYLEIYIVSYYLCYRFLAKRLYKNGEIRLQNQNILLLSVLILLVDIIINAVVVYIDNNSNSVYEIVICIYNILCCILVFYIQMSVVNTRKMEREIETAQQLLQKARKQYEISRENINSINRKCHDLKYQVRSLGKKSEIDDQYIREIENMISIYDANVKTGNEAIDIILTEKSLSCFHRGIKLTCMADCEKLGFIHDSDLYVLFGNAIDNAIEAVGKIADEEKKYIGLTVYCSNAMISINVHNYFEGKMKLDEEGFPITTKEDKECHGFGMKSIKMIAEKYCGDVSIVVRDHIFNLNIFIPVKE